MNLPIAGIFVSFLKLFYMAGSVEQCGKFITCLCSGTHSAKKGIKKYVHIVNLLFLFI